MEKNVDLRIIRRNGFQLYVGKGLVYVRKLESKLVKSAPAKIKPQKDTKNS